MLQGIALAASRVAAVVDNPVSEFVVLKDPMAVELPLTMASLEEVWGSPHRKMAWFNSLASARAFSNNACDVVQRLARSRMVKLHGTNHVNGADLVCACSLCAAQGHVVRDCAACVAAGCVSSTEPTKRDGPTAPEATPTKRQDVAAPAPDAVTAEVPPASSPAAVSPPELASSPPTGGPPASSPAAAPDAATVEVPPASSPAAVSPAELASSPPTAGYSPRRFARAELASPGAVTTPRPEPVRCV
jgi:hypothetical protein